MLYYLLTALSSGYCAYPHGSSCVRLHQVIPRTLNRPSISVFDNHAEEEDKENQGIAM